MYVVRVDGAKIPVTPFPYTASIDNFSRFGKWLATREKYGKREHWFSEPLFIDTETSHDDDKSAWIHQWAICWAGQVIVGRTAEQLIYFLQTVNSWAKQRGKNRKVLCYIHNASYDLTYLEDFFPEPPEYFAVKAHRILTAKWERIEIRCSYLLTQKSLDKWGKDSAPTYHKLAGEYDYKIVRTPSTPISDEEWAYQLNDVFTMWDAWKADREKDGFDVRNIPLTSTGFVRLDCREKALSTPGWQEKLLAMQPDIKVYDALEEAFAGGYTHGNRLVKNQTITDVIGHRDFTSSYPARQFHNLFPMGNFTPANIKTNDDINRLYTTQALLLHVVLESPVIRHNGITAPYISWSKLHKYEGENIDSILDNGRVLRVWSKSGGTAKVDFWLTEYDWFIIRDQYKSYGQDKLYFWIIESYSAPKGKLPKWFRNVLYKYWKDKCTLKHTDYATYMLSKAKFNSAFGMGAERNIRPTIKYIDGEWIETELNPEERENALAKYVRKKTTFQPFFWSCWVTAIARYELFRCIQLIGYDNFLYSDTDSIFYLSSPEIEARIEDYNSRNQERAEREETIIQHNGETFVLGAFTKEEDFPLKAFRFVHAKCYASIDQNNKLNVTIAGVTKKQRSNPALTNADELGKIDNLSPGFIFRECGGTRIIYSKGTEGLTPYVYNGETIITGKWAIIADTEYQVNDNDLIDEDLLYQARLISGKYWSDIYGGFEGVK